MKVEGNPLGRVLTDSSRNHQVQQRRPRSRVNSEKPGWRPAFAEAPGWTARYEMLVCPQTNSARVACRVIDVPTLVMHGDDDQIVPIVDSAPLSVKLLKKGTLKVYEKFPHGMCTTHADVINADLLAFIKG
jgi:pimeloyl-ACP methyl ester carboxylesterase